MKNHPKIITVQLDDRIRNTSSALLLTRFADEQTQFQKHPLTTMVSSHLQSFRKHPFISLVNDLAQTWWMDKFYSLAVKIDENYPPEIKTTPLFDFPPKYPELFYTFCHDAELDKLWERTNAHWTQAVKDCSVILQKGKVEDFLCTMFPVIQKKLVFIPCPLIPPSFGFGVANHSASYSLVGPPVLDKDENTQPYFSLWQQKLSQLIVHEFSHTLLESQSNHKQLVTKIKHLSHKMTYKGYFPKMYSNSEGQLNEIIVRAIETLYMQITEGTMSANLHLDNEVSTFGITLLRDIFQDFQNLYLRNLSRDPVEICDYLIEAYS